MKKRNVSRAVSSALATLIVVAAVISVISFSVLAHSTTDLTPSRITPGSSIEVLVDRTINRYGDGELISFNVTNVSSYSVDLWRIEIPLDRPAELVETWWHDDVEIWIANETTLVIRARYSIGVNSGYRGGCTIKYLDFDPQKEKVDWPDGDLFMMQHQILEADNNQDNFFPFTFDYRGEEITLNNLDEVNNLVLFKYPVDFFYRGETYRVTSNYSLPFDLTEVFLIYNNESICADITQNASITPWMGQTDLPELVLIMGMSVDDFFERERSIQEVLRKIEERLN